MEIRELRSAIALAQELNFNAAAKAVSLSQPAFSLQIKKLEETLGTKLFERSPKNVKLTRAGEVFIPEIAKLLESIQRKALEIRDETGEITGKIQLAAIPTISPYLLPKLLPVVKQKAPKLQLELFEETTGTILKSMKKGRFDLSVLALPINESGLIEKSISTELFLLAVSKRHPLASRQKITLKEIKKERLLILQEGHCFSDQSLEYCELSRRDPHVVFQGSSLMSVMKLAAIGEGVTLVPQMAVDEASYPNLKFIPFQGKKPIRDIGVLWRLSSPLSKAHHLILDSLEEILS